MRIKYKLASIAFTLFFTVYWSQAQENTVLKDTINFSDANTEAVIEFGETLQNTLHQSDSEWYSSKLNGAMFFDELFKSTPEIKPEEEFARGYVDGLSMSLEAFPKKIISDIENGAYYDFINYRYDPYLQTYFVLFRLYDPVSGLNYHDYKLVKIDDDIQFSDMYVYLTGEYLSNTIVVPISMFISSPDICKYLCRIHIISINYST